VINCQLSVISAVFAAAACAAGSDLDEFKVKGAPVFEFAQKPTVLRDGDKVTIAFTSKAFCDATVAIEDANGRIVRHLASGVLGVTAPAPFKKGSLRQSIVWDGKNDQGTYLDDKDALTVRASLGLRPQFERTLFWMPKRRPALPPPLFAAAKEGVYVYLGGTAIDSLILYDRDGNYVRTVYPFPGDKVEQTQGLQWRTFPQDGRRLPLKTNFLRCTMLTSGTNAGTSYTDHRKKNWDSPLANLQAHFAMYGAAAQAMALRPSTNSAQAGRIALAYLWLNRLGTDGTTPRRGSGQAGRLPLTGPRLTLPHKRRRGLPQQVSPHSVAFSPDGKTLYLTGYHFGKLHRATQDIVKLADIRTIPVVMRMDYEKNDAPTIFKGGLRLSDAGEDNEHFKVPSSVAVDKKGRVYVGDYMNDRVQIFSPAGVHLKTIKARRPAHVTLHEKTGDIYVFSWTIRNQYEKKGAKPALARYGPFENPRRIAVWPIGGAGWTGARGDGWGSMSPIAFVASIDSWADPVRVWIAEPWRAESVLRRGRPTHSVLQVLEIKGGKLRRVRDFAADCQRKQMPVRAPVYYRQRLYVNPANGKVYVAEGDGAAVGKSFHRLFEIDPVSGRHRVIQMPFNAEDMCFDLDGLAYLRSINVVGRYNPAQGWREVPFDYGEERAKVGYGWMSGTRYAHLVAGLVLPADGNWHHGGMHVSAKRHLLVACGYNVTMHVRTTAKYVHRDKKYLPKVFPGRLMGGRCGATSLHMWDQHGKLIAEDAAPGQCDLYGIGIDEHDNLYMMSSAPRMMPTQPPRRYPDRTSGSLIKFPRGKGRILTSGKGPKIKLPESQYPNRPFDTSGGNQGLAWMVDAEWMYGGVGFSGGNIGGCSCWNARFALDYFARSFAPEVTRYSVAVLDSAGNVVTRIGRYGNVDEGRPLFPKPASPRATDCPPNPRSVGGDEVVLFHAPYLATHTDHRLFVADPGNGRILSVQLGYAATERVALRDVPERRTQASRE